MDLSSLAQHSSKFKVWFKNKTHDNTAKSCAYLKGLFSYGKSNIERMAEQLTINDQQLHHFISVSHWDAKGVMGQVGQETERIFSHTNKAAKGLILDESGWLKKGKKSVGVAKQYLGSIGKVDNGQVSVFAAIAQKSHVGLVGAELYLPKQWTRDQKRMQEAGVPRHRWEYKTKAELGLQIIEELEGKVSYEWVGGDSIYGNSTLLRRTLDEKGKLFVLDTSINQQLYLQNPNPCIGQNKASSYRGAGRKRSNFTSDHSPVSIQQLVSQLDDKAWQKVKIRKGTKGWLVRQAAVIEVYLWSGKRPNNEHVEHYRLLLSRHLDSSELKYSFVNDVKEPREVAQLVYYQMQRYWIERSFQETKQQLGMTQYQIRNWKALYHHLALTMMAFNYILEQQLLHENDIPLLSASDVKIFIAHNLIRQIQQDTLLEQMVKRHQKRQEDINRYYKL